MSNALFPLLFTLERVENGYILTAKEETGSLTKEAEFSKEVVTDDKINHRIGQLLHLDKMNKEQAVVFYVEHVTEKTYKTENEKSDPDELMDAKLTFVHYHLPKKKEGVLVLNVTDTKTLEIIGKEAEDVAKANNLVISRSGKVPFLRFPDTPDSRRTIAGYCNNRTNLMDITTEKIIKWYNDHRIKE